MCCTVRYKSTYTESVTTYSGLMHKPWNKDLGQAGSFRYGRETDIQNSQLFTMTSPLLFFMVQTMDDVKILPTASVQCTSNYAAYDYCILDFLKGYVVIVITRSVQ
jgi:hypothetical protein